MRDAHRECSGCGRPARTGPAAGHASCSATPRTVALRCVGRLTPSRGPRRGVRWPAACCWGSRPVAIGASGALADALAAGRSPGLVLATCPGDLHRQAGRPGPGVLPDAGSCAERSPRFILWRGVEYRVAARARRCWARLFLPSCRRRTAMTSRSAAPSFPTVRGHGRDQLYGVSGPPEGWADPGATGCGRGPREPGQWHGCGRLSWPRLGPSSLGRLLSAPSSPEPVARRHRDGHLSFTDLTRARST